MSGDTAIQWTSTYHADGTVTKGSVWNPVVGCTKPKMADGSISEGCRNCYAFEVHGARHTAFQGGKLQNIPQYAQPFTTVQLLHQRIDKPLRWRKPRRVFVNSMSDLFHEAVPDEYINKVFGVMYVAAEAYNLGHTFQVLTKRPARMRDYLLTPGRRQAIADALPSMQNKDDWFDDIAYGDGPLTSKRIWLGTSVESQAAAQERIPLLLDTPAAVRFLSCEPLLGPVDLLEWLWFDHCPEELNPAEYGATPDDACSGCEGQGRMPGSECVARMGSELHWVIAGGESGQHARPMNADWARLLRDRCASAGIPFFFKQWGMFNDAGQRAPSGRGWTTRLLDGQEHNEFPEVRS